MDAFRSLMFRYYKKEKDRADKCLSDIIDMLNSGDEPRDTLDEIEGRIMHHYDRS
jgi:hypothetical protein